MKRRNFLAAGAAAASYPLIAPGMGIGRLMAQETGRMMFLTPQGFSLAFSTVMYGRTGGFFAAEGLDVHVEGGRGAAQSIQLVAADQVQAGRTGGANYMVARVENNAPVLAFATIAQVSPFFMISPSEDPILEPEDYVGKVVGMASLGGSMEATLDLMLRRNNLNPADVRRERVADTPAGFGLIEAGRLNGFFGNVSTTTRLLAQEDLSISASPVRDGIPGQVYVATEENLENRRAEFVAFTRGCYNAIQDIASRGRDLAPVIESMRSEFDIPGSDNLEVATEDLYANSQLWLTNGVENALRCDPEQWAEAVNLLVEAGSLSGQPEIPLYTNDIWDEANAG